jgi:dGTPase
VREGIVKHSRDFACGEDPELDEYLPGQRPLLEAQLIDLADEIAYDTSDLDDAFSVGLIHASSIAAQVPAFQDAWETVQTSYPAAAGHEQFSEALRLLIDGMVSGLIQGTVSAARESGAAAYADVRAWPTRLARFTPEAKQAAVDLKSFLHRFMYEAGGLDRDRQLAAQRIGWMFARFLDHPELLPAHYCDAALTEPLHRVVCDYIAGMTDTFFDRVYSSEVVKLESSAERTI